MYNASEVVSQSDKQDGKVQGWGWGGGVGEHKFVIEIISFITIKVKQKCNPLIFHLHAYIQFCLRTLACTVVLTLTHAHINRH